MNFFGEFTGQGIGFTGQLTQNLEGQAFLYSKIAPLCLPMVVRLDNIGQDQVAFRTCLTTLAVQASLLGGSIVFSNNGEEHKITPPSLARKSVRQKMLRKREQYFKAIESLQSGALVEIPVINDLQKAQDLVSLFTTKPKAVGLDRGGIMFEQPEVQSAIEYTITIVHELISGRSIGMVKIESRVDGSLFFGIRSM